MLVEQNELFLVHICFGSVDIRQSLEVELHYLTSLISNPQVTFTFGD